MSVSIDSLGHHTGNEKSLCDGDFEVVKEDNDDTKEVCEQHPHECFDDEVTSFSEGKATHQGNASREEDDDEEDGDSKSRSSASTCNDEECGENTNKSNKSTNFSSLFSLRVPVIVYVLFGLAFPLVILSTASTAERDKVMSDTTVLLWCLFIHLSVALHTTCAPLRRQEETKQTPYQRIIVLLATTVCLVILYVLFVILAEEPDMPQLPILHDLTSNTGVCQPFNLHDTWEDISCRNISYYYELEPQLVLDFRENGTKFVGRAGLSVEELRGVAGARVINRMMRLIVPILTLSIPRAKPGSITDTHVETYVSGCQLALETFTCSFFFRPCTGSCSGSYLPCRSMCRSVLESCPGIESLYELIAPGANLRSIVYAAESEFGTLYRALDRAFISLSECDQYQAEANNNRSQCSDGLSFVATQEEGMCNPTTRAALERENTQQMTQYTTRIEDRNNEIERLQDARRGMPFGLFVLFVLCVWLSHADWRLCCCCGCNCCPQSSSHISFKDRLIESNQFWKRWYEITPKLTHLATPMQISVAVLLLLMARHIEVTFSQFWYVALLENMLSLVLLAYTIETIVCYVRLEDDCNPSHSVAAAQTTTSGTRRRRTTIMHEVSVYGRFFAPKVIAQEIAEVVVQFTYFFVTINTTDMVTIIIQSSVLFANIVVTPYLMMTRRVSVVLFDAMIEGIYLTINILNVLTRDEDTQSLSALSVMIEMASLCFSSWGCVSSLFVLSQYYFHYTYTGMVVWARPASRINIVVRSVDEDDKGDEPSSAAPQPNMSSVVPVDWSFLGNDEPPPASDSQNTNNYPTQAQSESEGGGGESIMSVSNANIKLQSAKSSVSQRALIPASALVRRVVCSVFLIAGLGFFMSVMVRVGVQDKQCRDHVGDMLWDQVTPKLLFRDGFAADTTCDFSVMTRLDLSGADLREVPSGLSYLTSLRALDLSHNQLVRVDFEPIVKLTKLNTLDVSNNKITWLHPNLLEQLPLTALYVKNNPLENVINWENSNLQSIPRHLALLNQTDTLLLRGNNITSLDIFESFNVTTTLDLSYNNLRTIHAKTFSRFSMNLLNLSHNQLTATEALSSYSFLYGFIIVLAREVDVSYNLLDVMPSAFLYSTTQSAAANLILHIHHNNVTEINLSNRSSLTSNINMAFLAEIKDDLLIFDASNQINAHGAPIGIANSTSLRVLNFSDVGWGLDPREQRCRSFQYNTWWEIINSMKTLETLDVSSDPAFHSTCVMPPWGLPLNVPTLKRLWARGFSPRGGIWDCEIGSCLGRDMLSTVEEIDASGYNVSDGGGDSTDLPFPNIALFKPNLRRLYLDHTTLAHSRRYTEILARVAENNPTHFEYLSFHGSDIEQLIVDRPFPNLRVLDVSEANLINLLDLNAVDFPQLETLDLSGNNIVELDAPRLFSDLRSLKCAIIGPQRQNRMVTITNVSSLTAADLTQLQVVDLCGVEASSVHSLLDKLSQFGEVLQRICVGTDEDLLKCYSSFSHSNNNICTKSDVSCRADRLLRCGLEPHVYSPFSQDVFSELNLFCTMCQSTCARDIIFGDNMSWENDVFETEECMDMTTALTATNG